MSIAIFLAKIFCLLATLVHLGSIALVTLRGRPSRLDTANPHGQPPVSILRPVCGIEHAIDRTLGSGFALDYPDYELIFCVASDGDPAIPGIRRLMAANPAVPARLLIGDDRISINPKLNNLVKGWAAAKHEWIVMTDSNVLMPPDYIDRMLERWDATTGLVCSPPLGSEPEGYGAEFECAFLNTYQARWQLAADALGQGFAQGKSMFLRRENLDRHGGIAALAADPAEDAAATKAIRANGQRVRLVRQPFAQPLGARGLRAVWSRQLRWARLRRVTFPAFFCMEFLTGGLFPIAIATWLAFNDAIPGWIAPLLAVAWYAAEAFLAKNLDWHYSRRSPLAWILRDLSLPVLWIAAVCGNGFEWRGNQMDVKKDSLLATEAD
ncbi:ceramide glucosyltransferase [Kaistia defluvii]|uniref:ceramide glucosyltransferase n=1 Tax=Kaistia defluvii TaxID=410841 RepID=UPI002255991D|nr:ceramide glucosyltransferase [Kaistia defluvii]MCX5519926.1 ceramide glucosyltransferase [Kaistia defluvii]